MWLTKLAAGLDAWAFPPECILCGDPGAAPGFDLCEGCEGDLPRCEPALQPVAPGPSLDALWCAFHYAFPVDGMIRELKFGGQLAYAQVLGLALLRRLRAAPAGEMAGVLGASTALGASPSIEVAGLLPVPLHHRRLSERGFNQAWEIARPVARALHLPMLAGPVVRRRDTLPQTLIGADRRRQNLHGAFEVRRPVHGRSFLLLDDVTTTGSTLIELARVLKAGGARRVTAMVVATATPVIL
ncbi:MAG: ComF family protein [Steroidobacteraceae bacterium]